MTPARSKNDSRQKINRVEQRRFSHVRDMIEEDQKEQQPCPPQDQSMRHNRYPDEEQEPMRQESKPLVHTRPAFEAPARCPISPLPKILAHTYYSMEDYHSYIKNNPEIHAQCKKAFSTNMVVRKTTLKEIRLIPQIWTGHGPRLGYYRAVAYNVYRRTGVVVTPERVSAFFNSCKDALRTKIKHSVEKLHHSPTQTEAFLWKWPLYGYIRFIRPSMQYEDRVRRGVAHEPIVLDDDEDDFPLDVPLEKFVELEVEEEEVDNEVNPEEELNDVTLHLPSHESPNQHYAGRSGRSSTMQQYSEHSEHSEQDSLQHMDPHPYEMERQQPAHFQMQQRLLEQLQMQHQQFAWPAALGAPGAFGWFPDNRASTSSPAGLGQMHSASPSPGIQAQHPAVQRQLNPADELSDLEDLLAQARRAARDMPSEKVKVLRSTLFAVVFFAELNDFDSQGDLLAKLAEQNNRR